MSKVLACEDVLYDVSAQTSEKKEKHRILSEDNITTPTDEDIDPTVKRTMQSTRMRDIPNVLRSLERMSMNGKRSKPLYSDCWMIDSDDIDIIESYDIPFGKVTIGNSQDGQAEYFLRPSEYKFKDDMNGIINSVIGEIRGSFDSPSISLGNIMSAAKNLLMKHSDGLTSETIEETAHIVHRYTVGLGIFEILLGDPRLEDIYIDAPCEKNRIHVTLNGIAGFNSHIRCRTNLIADKKEIRNLISILKRDSGLPFCESSPVLETDVTGYEARATVVGYPMSPNGDAVAIRKHSSRPWTLTRLIGNGTMDPMAAGVLSYLVDSRCTFLICGSRGAGKSSLLSALLFEFPISQRILTIEDTSELPADKMRKMGYKVQSMLIDDRMGSDTQKRAEEALRVSLRLGESAIILGEVRGDEARTLYQSMRTGRAGSSIMGTIHGDSARSVYERVVHDMHISPDAFAATDIVVTVGTKKPKGSIRQYRRLNEIALTSDKHGQFVQIPVNGNLSDNKIFDTPMFRRVLGTSSLTKDEIIDEMTVRAEMRKFLAEMASAHSDEFYGPEWICFANEHLSKALADGSFDKNETTENFKKWFGRYNGLC
ncbi:MAG: type II/IV secretion system ATPase subunit [Methanomassiliicoccaceae archaeon]|jgi:type IV secretory pathway ATPase VirB11/archaellum biosynthesis ATPase|nr:type II/IV secretion system ATPase subunit [Methanomassiliicoccaceae archaeon]